VSETEFYASDHVGPGVRHPPVASPYDVGVAGLTSPVVYARTTACTRSRSPSLARIRATWDLTVASDRCRWPASSALLRPWVSVVATPFLTATQTRVGDTVVLTDDGTQITVRIVGEAFNDDHDGMQILTAAETLPDLQPEHFYVTVQHGTDPEAYAEALGPEIQQFDAYAMTENIGTPEIVLVINALTTVLSLMLVTVAALGVLNMVVLETREHVHDLGIHKALGMAPR
jgi:putative ABC transport system permease protein